MRTRDLRLTHEEIELILRALGMAEMQFSTLRKQYIENVVNVRGVDSLSLKRKEADGLLDMENQFCDLLLEIKDGQKDV
jgi:hypothetical protein